MVLAVSTQVNWCETDQTETLLSS